jgi:hypothetical protein
VRALSSLRAEEQRLVRRLAAVHIEIAEIQSKPITLDGVLAEVAAVATAYFGTRIPTTAIIGPGQNPRVRSARQAAAIVARKRGHTIVGIGELLCRDAKMVESLLDRGRSADVDAIVALAWKDVEQ